MAYDYDLFVIGAGSGGVRAARLAAGYGARVAIAEEFRYGGTCVIRGCVPKKLYVYASRFKGGFEDAAGFGWQLGDTRFNWPALVAAKEAEITRLSGIYASVLDNADVKRFDRRAEIVSPHEVRLHPSGEVISAARILVAVGGTPFTPDIPGADLGITSNEAFDLPELPGSLAVIGGGYIAVEFASIFNGLGVETQLIYRGPSVLRGFDEDIRAGLTEALSGRGIKVVLNASPAKIEKANNSLLLQLDDGQEIETGAVMFATGRVPATSGLGLENAGVNCRDNGAIVVDDYSQSSCPSIYAVGDVTDRVALTPVAIREGAAFAETVYNNHKLSVDHDLIPTAVFSEPEVGTIGLSEEEAINRYGAVDVFKSVFNPMKNTLGGRVEKTIMKMIVKADDGRVLGVHILGPDAGEIVQGLGIAMKMGATKADFDATMALHPSAAEELVTMKDGVRKTG